MEIFYFLFLFIAGTIFLIKGGQAKEWDPVLVILLLGWSVVVRTSGLDGDMNVYDQTLLAGPSYTFYYLREPLYWFGAWGLFSFLNYSVLVFIVFDMISFLILMRISHLWGLPRYFVILWVLFFPVVMGMQNVYRQFISIHFLLGVLYFIQVDRSKKQYLLFVFSVLTHNAAALFMPLLYVFKNSKFKFGFAACVVLSLLPAGVLIKSSESTGTVSVFLYLLISFGILYFFSVSQRLRFSGGSKGFFYLQLYLLLLLMFSIVFMQDGQSKRVAMYSFVLLLPYTTIFVERNFGKLIRFIYFVLVSFPTLIFSSSRLMLLS